MDDQLERLKYPIGKFTNPESIDENQMKEWISILKIFPENIKKETENLSNKDLEKTYRPDGWSIIQVVNHCADSHINSFIRFKLALTENTPTIKAYHENLWAELSDSQHYPISSSIKILEGIHDRWVYLLENLTESDLNKTFRHPETNALISLKTNIGIYAWHCQHHLAHIINAKK